MLSDLWALSASGGDAPAPAGASRRGPLVTTDCAAWSMSRGGVRVLPASSGAAAAAAPAPSDSRTPADKGA
eukprot:6971824-Pyramimonas_sp.AAC.1